jgi:type I restriction enzyme S subunit
VLNCEQQTKYLAGSTSCDDGFETPVLTAADFYAYVENNQEGAGYPAISNSRIMNYKILLPPIEEQNRIVGILNKFDALVNDISEGLSAEIKARGQQYEYYWNKLLTFDEYE